MGASQQILIATGGSSGAPATTWDSANKGPNIALSNGDLDAQWSGAGWQSVRGTNGRDAGLRQFELEAILVDSFVLLGAVNQDFASYTDFVGNSTNTSGCGSLGYHCQSGASWYEHLESNASSSGAHGNPITSGDVFGVGIDFSGGNTIKFYKNGTLVLTRSGFTTLDGSKLWYPAASVQQSGQARLRCSGLTFPIAGYTAWDS